MKLILFLVKLIFWLAFVLAAAFLGGMYLTTATEHALEWAVDTTQKISFLDGARHFLSANPEDAHAKAIMVAAGVCGGLIAWIVAKLLSLIPRRAEPEEEFAEEEVK